MRRTSGLHWGHVSRVAEKGVKNDHTARHFLGAVVLQQETNSTGTLMRTIIDGQQRLTTLQLLFDAIHEEIVRVKKGGQSGATHR